jgi:APA family basic amino acid/polyamine antiporter
MLFWRVKSLDQILKTAEKKSLKRQLGAFQLTMLGIGAIIGTGIFVLTAEAAQKSGPGMMASFIIAGFVCAVAALCYAELASMVPVSGSAYTYSYAVLGEFIAWLVGWALILEYAVAASAVCVGWSKYAVGLFKHSLNIEIPATLANGWSDGGYINLPAIVIGFLVTVLLVRGTKESATVNAILVSIKIVALGLFIVLAVPVAHDVNFHPFAPLGTPGIIGAAASIFFAFVGFDAVSTAAEETNNPQRNIPIGLIGSLVICTIFYMLVAVGVIGSVGATPVMDAHGVWLSPGTAELTARCKELAAAGQNHIVSCSGEALADVLRWINYGTAGNLVALAAFLALPSVILTMIFGQTRIFFVMSRDGLLPPVLSKVHPRFKTPHIVTMMTGLGVIIGAAFLPVGKLADISNSGTLFAFLVVSLAVMMLRRSDPDRRRPFRTPLVWIVGPMSVIGCVVLFFFLPTTAKLVFPIWGGIGLIFYFLYGYRKSYMKPGNVSPDEDYKLESAPVFHEGPDPGP